MNQKDYLNYQLDQKFNSVNDANSQDFLLVLIQFLDFTLDDERLKPHVDQLIHNFQKRISDYEISIEKQTEEIIHIRKEFALQFPTIDDSHLLPQPTSKGINSPFHTDPYYKSLAFFDSIIRGERHNLPILPPRGDQLDDLAPPRLNRAINLLIDKVNSIPKEHLSNELATRLDDFLYGHKLLQNRFSNYCRVAPEASLLRLLMLRDRENPPPKPYKTWSEKLSGWMEGSTEPFVRREDKNKPREYYITHLRRVYEELRVNIMKPSTPVQVLPDYDREQLYQNMIKHFNINELERLCFTMTIDPESLDRKNKESTIMSLITWCERRNLVDDLLKYCRELRPDAQW